MTVRMSDMREEDVPEHGLHTYADIHRRLDKLDERMHSVELSIARGTRFPAPAYVGMVALLVSIIGTGGVLYSELQISKLNSTKSLALVESHLAQAPQHRMAVQELSKLADEWLRVLPQMQERCEALDRRVSALERRSEERDRWWSKVWESGVLKGAKP